MELFTQVTALAALAVVAVQQILKLNVVPVYFANKYPVVTNIVLSIIASIIVQYQTAVNLVGWVQWVVYIATVSVVAAITYNSTLRNDANVQAASNKVAPTA
jgi:hypothetical protein